MIDVEEATQIARSYFEELYDEQPFSNVLLEEVERDEEDGTSYWFITTGFTNKKQEEDSSSPLSSLTSGSPRRYKRFKTNAKTEDAVSMKIRTVENA